MLHIRILYKFLPSNFDQLQHFIAPPPITYSPLNIDHEIDVQFRNKCQKMIQETKRTWLNTSISVYEMNIQAYDHQYQEVLIQLESLLLNHTSVDGASLFNEIKQYMICRVAQIQQDIYKKMSVFRGKVLQHRQRSSSTRNMIGVSPEPYLDLISNPFNTLQWNYLSLGNLFLMKSITLLFIHIFSSSSFLRSILYKIKSKCKSSKKATKYCNYKRTWKYLQ